MYPDLQPVPLSQASGPVAYNMTNDALFHIVFQNNHKALTGLIASLLHLDPSSIRNIVIQNPLIYGHQPQEKNTVLDILVSYNDGSIMDLEMQVHNFYNWIPRSLYYLCREYTNLHHGDDYSQVKPVYHVGFLDYTLFNGQTSFYSTYRMSDLKTGNVYSDKLTLAVVELNHIDMATEEDKAYGIDKWAALFKSTTWEEVKMLAQTDPYIESAAESMYSSVTEPWVLELCKKSQEEIDGDRHRRERLAEQDRQIAENEKQIAENEKQIAKNERQIAERDKEIAELKSQNAELSKQIAELRAMLTEQAMSSPLT